jgi:hypothetical protein
MAKYGSRKIKAKHNNNYIVRNQTGKKTAAAQTSQNSYMWTFLAILFIVLFLSTLYLYLNKNESVFSLLTGSSTGNTVVEQTAVQPMDKDAAATKALDFFNSHLIGGEKTAVLVTTEENDGFYIVKMSYNERIYESYITKDGKFFFPKGYDLDNTASSS